MTILPLRSPGVLIAPLTSEVIVFDLVPEVAHRLNATAAALLAVCDGTTGLDEPVGEWCEQTGADRSVVAARVATGLVQLRDLGLVERTTAVETPRHRPDRLPR